jgi:lipopolysaccharide/colanic/teichoic acid biosynthesis glycosyltransferase
MLYRYGEVFRTLLMVADGVLLAGTWMAAYALRFHSGLPTPLGVPPAVEYVYPIAVILPIFLAFFRSHGLYEARRMDSPLGEASAVIRATAVAVLALAAISFFARSYFDSRLTLVFFALLAPTAIIALRSSLRLALRAVRRRGFNLRYVLVVGSGPLAEMVVQRISGRPDAGLRLIGVVADGALGGCVAGAPVIGRYGELKSILRGQRVDQVLIALSRHESGVFEKVAAELEDEVVNVKIVPDLMHGFSLRSTVESLDGLTSGRPILYRQRRMGHDGRGFEMLKFRSMRRDAEAAGPGWTRANDPRRTRIGRWLRKRDLDELPQLFNVLRGDMSLVGPRPERPAYIEAFRREVPGYMLRHKVRAGMTGWAQVHGWRGDTSIQERVEHDLYYIQRWSLWLDLRILFMTLFRRRSAARAEVAATAPAELSARGSG